VEALVGVDGEGHGGRASQRRFGCLEKQRGGHRGGGDSLGSRGPAEHPAEQQRRDGDGARYPFGGDDAAPDPVAHIAEPQEVEEHDAAQNYRHAPQDSNHGGYSKAMEVTVDDERLGSRVRLARAEESWDPRKFRPRIGSSLWCLPMLAQSFVALGWKGGAILISRWLVRGASMSN